MTIYEILHAILTIAAGADAQPQIHAAIDKLEADAKGEVEKVVAKAEGFLAPPEATS